MKKTIIISAYPCCGKTTATELYKDKYSMMDIDSSKFSWTENFPENYISYIKEYIGEVDFIFVSSHLSVREALQKANLKYITVYPAPLCKTEWVGRMWLRGNNNQFIQKQVDNWEEWTDPETVQNGPHGLFTYRLYPNEYIDESLLELWYYRNGKFGN